MNRSMRERRILRARKIAHRRRVAKNKCYFNWLLGRNYGRFADRLTYRVPDLQLIGLPYHDRQKLDALNFRMEDYYNEGLCEY